ncbi:MAG: AtpZ/AtpI family protein [Phycisphaerae bacterium]|nr:AtpZ/AtpI family protein [Phycisphaerae bacterium]
MDERPKSKPEQSELARGLSHGLEVAIGVGIGYFGGNWFDHRFNSKPWGLLVGVLLGCAAGLYLLIKEATASEKRDVAKDKRDSVKSDQNGPNGI